MCSDVRMNDRRFHGSQLRSVRERGGIRMVDLAREAGCSYSHLRMCERSGRPGAEKQDRQPSTELAYRLAHALTRLTGREVSIDEFTTPNEDEAAA